MPKTVFYFILICLLSPVYSCYKDVMNHHAQSPQEEKQIGLLQKKLKMHIKVLSEEIGERNVLKIDQLNQAKEYIKKTWEEYGYTVKGQSFVANQQEFTNLWVDVPGRYTSDEVIVIGAHYDTFINTPGANDNASGVAAVLEISRLLSVSHQGKTVRFIAFANEEPPFFKTEGMGSRVYAAEAKRQKENIIVMISLETIGYYRERRKTQHYPFPLGLFYPDKGNFIGVVGNWKSSSFVKTFVKYFKQGIHFPVESISPFIPFSGIDLSDHSSFWQNNYPAFMVTDTAPFRYPYYHSPNDKEDKLSYPEYSQVTFGIYRAIVKMAND